MERGCVGRERVGAGSRAGADDLSAFPFRSQPLSVTTSTISLVTQNIHIMISDSQKNLIRKCKNKYNIIANAMMELIRTHGHGRKRGARDKRMHFQALGKMGPDKL